MAFVGAVVASAVQPAESIGLLPPAAVDAPDHDSPRPKRRRTSPKPRAVTRWIQRDVEGAQKLASGGDLSRAGQLYRALNRDGVVLGLLGTRSGGLVRLPKRFTGDPNGITYLQGSQGRPGAFNRIFPTAELAKLARDGFVLGVGVAEFVDRGCGPVLTRLDPEFLLYRWWEDQWYYRSSFGLQPITPGDGRWVLYLPGGAQEPWDQGAWAALARAFVSKEHALLYRENWNAKLAHPARVAYSPQAATDEQAQSWFRSVMAWGMNTVFGLKPGYEVKLLESNGRGFESFRETISDSNQEFMIIIAGQVVTVTGGAGFANADIHATIRGDLIEGDGKSLAECLCEQAIPHILVGIVPQGEIVVFEWDTRPPISRKDEADALSAAAKAIEDIVRSHRANGLEPDVKQLSIRFGVPLVEVQQIAARAGGSGDAANDVEIVFDDECNDGCDPADVELEDEAVAALAAKMTEHGIERCEHNHSNRCWKCGIERVRDFDYQDGAAVWSVAWRPIPRQGSAVAA